MLQLLRGCVRARLNLVIAGGNALVVYAGARAVMSGALTVGQLIVNGA